MARLAAACLVAAWGASASTADMESVRAPPTSAARPAPPAVADPQPLCCETGFWSTAGCLGASSARLAKDAAEYAGRRVLPQDAGAALWSRLPPQAHGLWALAADAADHVRASVPDGWNWTAARSLAEKAATQALPKSARAAVTEVVERERTAFVAAFPQHAAALGDATALLMAAAWLLLAAYVAYRGVRLCTAAAWTAGKPEVLFFPDRSGRNVQRISEELAKTKGRLWLSMFVLTEDILANQVIRAHGRGVDVRVIVDDEHYQDLGSDVQRLMDAGVPVLMDDGPARMHHKFAVLDTMVLTGSFNWTHMASVSNFENLCILRDRHIVEAFGDEFTRLWRTFKKRGRSTGREGSNGRGRSRAQTPPARGGG